MELFDALESAFKESSDSQSTKSANGMVATAKPEATAVGSEILKRGGNAVDAAVASALALGVCEPQASGIGGQTMMIIHTGKATVAIDGSSRAPSLAHVNAIYKRDRSRGYRASTVPSTMATLYYVLKRYGTFTWQQVVEPAVELASKGYTVTKLQHQLLIRESDNFDKIESGSGKHYFFKKERPYLAGEIHKQPDLAKTLARIGQYGVEDFYSGHIAKQIDADMRENGGLLRYDDLALIPWPIVRKPIRKSFRGFPVYSMPLPGAGRTLLYTLSMFDLLPADVMRDESEHKRIHLLAEVFRKALKERSGRPFDPNFYPQIQREDKEMLRGSFARKSLKSILRNVNKRIITSIASEDEFSGETTHLSVMDKLGMAVSLTQSIERAYGSKAAAAGLGFLYNNYLMDFEYSIPSHPFYLRPNAVPWATVAPTILFTPQNKLWMALGSPGSERIFSAITQFLLHIIDGEMPLDQAVAAPRIHCSMGGRISLEAERFPAKVLDFFQNKGYRIDIRDGYSFYLGCIQAVMRCTDGSFQGVADPRRDGTAAGP
jgi:gamma-glutamyltranspeptidase/glutathione hydrolase